MYKLSFWGLAGSCVEGVTVFPKHCIAIFTVNALIKIQQWVFKWEVRNVTV
jgi:hypothetical protein